MRSWNRMMCSGALLIAATSLADTRVSSMRAEAAPAAQALLGGQISMMFDNVTLASESIKAGQIRALGVASKERSSALMDVPTLVEQGIPLEISAWFGLVAPAGTPPAGHRRP